jgi:hypothetical protein
MRVRSQRRPDDQHSLARVLAEGKSGRPEAMVVEDDRLLDASVADRDTATPRRSSFALARTIRLASPAAAKL